MSNLNERSVESIFREVIASDEESRSRILQAIDSQKRHQVDELLKLDAEADAQGLLQTLQTTDVFNSRFPAGTILSERYRIVSLIGHGGMGEVYRADDLQLGQTVALKFQPAQIQLDQSQDNQLRNEVRLARQVAHPHVCQVYDIGEFEGQCFITMKYIDGEDLSSLLRRIGRLSHDKAMEVSQQLCAGLSAAHAKGVLHRDLKPANIMLDGSGNAHITDFGLAMISSDGPSAVDSSGTPAYMAPEQILEGTTSIQSDLYALGLILYEMFTGQRANRHRTIPELRAMHQNASGPVKPSDVVDDVSPTVDAAIRRCLESDPAGRPKSAASLANLLSAGDPLIAAMITDEVPSPELVATYGEPGILSPKIAIALCGVLIAGMISLLSLCDRSRSVNLAGFGQPELLQQDAKDILSQFGYERDGFDSSMGFLGGEGDPAFWYRESPAPLIGVQIPLEAMPANYGTIVNLLDPAWTTPGMLGVKLDATSGGKLSWFRAIPMNTRVDDQTKEDQTPWKEWFGEDIIGFDLDLLSVATWRHTPRDACDRHMAWEGQLGDSDQMIYVEAMAYRDRPTWFRVMKEDEFKAAGSAADPVYQVNREAVLSLSITNVVTVLMIAFFALRNWRLRRCDRHGAWKIAVVVFVGQVIGWTCLTSHTLQASEIFLVRDGLKSAIGSAFTAWLVYLALEPFVRKHVPQLLVSWSRLLDGRFLDPIVGRDLLIVATIVVWVEASLAFIQSLPGGNPLKITHVPIQGWSSVIGSGVGGGSSFITWMLIIFTTFALVLRFSRSRFLAGGFILLGISLSACARDENVYYVYLYMLVAICPAIATVRYGLLFLVAFGMLDNLLLQPITMNPSSFYFETGLFCVLFVLAVGFWGAYISLGSKRKHLLQPEYQ